MQKAPYHYIKIQKLKALKYFVTNTLFQHKKVVIQQWVSKTIYCMEIPMNFISLKSSDTKPISHFPVEIPSIFHITQHCVRQQFSK